MNLDLKQLMERVAGLFGAPEEARTRPIARPVRDWKIMLGCVTLCVLLSALFAGYVYYDIHLTTTAETNTTLHSKVKDEDIKNMLSAFEDRARKHQGYEQGGGGVADPSR